MKRKSISANLDLWVMNIISVIVFVIYAPFGWLNDKWRYYAHERKNLRNEINHLYALLSRTERERDEYRVKADRIADYYKSENERLKKKLSSLGYSKKQINN